MPELQTELLAPRTSDSAKPGRKRGQLLVDRFRCPEDSAEFVVDGAPGREPGYFRLGPSAVCYGHCSCGNCSKQVTDSLYDARQDVNIDEMRVRLPFDPVEVLDNLRSERYYTDRKGIKGGAPNSRFWGIYYLLRPLLRVAVRKQLQKVYLRGWEKIPFPRWPVDRTVEDIFEQLLVLSMRCRKIERMPFIWFWPEGHRSCTIMTHDVETSAGRDFCPELMDINDSFGIKSSFQIVPEGRYPVPPSVLENIRGRGFEINVHDLNHDGRLMSDKEEFMRRAERINAYGRQFGSMGFRSAVMYRNIDWYGALEYSYDMSIPNVAHLDPQQGGCCTVLPFFIGKILELPLTTIQDYSLFNILNDHSIRLWKKQISLIREKHGLISFIIHPDYNIDPAVRHVYTELLQYLSELRSEGETWIALPGEAAEWWRLRSEMNLVKAGNSWRIEGEGKERAGVAYAVLADDVLTYELPPVS